MAQGKGKGSKGKGSGKKKNFAEKVSRNQPNRKSK